MILSKRRLLAAAATLPAALACGKLRAEPGEALPAFSFTTADGAERSIADFAGSAVVLNFWATWCIPCVAEMPALARLNGLVHEAGVRVLPLSSDRGGAATVERYFTEHDIVGLPVLLDPRGAAARAFGARGIPTTVLIDRAGRERGRVEGAQDWAGEKAVAMVRALAAEPR